MRWSFELFVVSTSEDASSYYISSDRVIDEQEHDGTNDGYYQTVEVQTGDACETEHEREPATDDRTNYSEEHIENHPPPR